VAESHVERQSLQRPLILDVNAQIDFQALAERDRLRILGDRRRHDGTRRPVQKRVSDKARPDARGRTVVVVPGVMPSLLRGEARLERVRAGDVAHRASLVRFAGDSLAQLEANGALYRKPVLPLNMDMASGASGFRCFGQL